jgi:hypothetical protein
MDSRADHDNFLSLLSRVCQLPSGSMAHDQVHQIHLDLEDYYLSFPSHLLEFSSLTHPYQAEAMIWLHGIFIISCMSPFCLFLDS